MIAESIFGCLPASLAGRTRWFCLPGPLFSALLPWPSHLGRRGDELWSFPGKTIWGVTPLDSGNVLLTDSVGVREVTRRGDVVWSWTLQDTPEYRVASLQRAWHLPNDNTFINNGINEFNSKPQGDTLQAVEVTPEKKVVWALRSWTSPFDLGPATTFQFLDGPGHFEDVHFGDIR